MLGEFHVVSLVTVDYLLGIYAGKYIQLGEVDHPTMQL